MFTYTSLSIGIGNSPYPNVEDYGTSYTTNNTNYTSSFLNSDTDRGNSESQSAAGAATYRSDNYHSNQTTYNTDTAGGKTQITLKSESSFFSNSSSVGRAGNGIDYTYLNPFGFVSNEGGTTSGEHYILANTYLLADGLYVSSFQSDETLSSKTASDSGTAVFSGSTLSNSFTYQLQELTISEIYIESFIYRGAETRYNNSTYYTSSYYYVNQTNTASGFYSTSSEYITTISNTCEYSTSFTFTETSTDPFTPTITQTGTSTYSGNCTFLSYGTTIEDDIFSPLRLSSSHAIEFNFLTKTTETSGSGTDTSTYLTITTSSTTADYLATYTSDGNFAKQIAYSTYSGYESQGGNIVTGLATAGSNWAWGHVGGILVRNGGNNQSFINKFSNLSVITENTIIEPNLTFNKYAIVRDTNNSSFEFSYIGLSYIETTYAQIYYEMTNQTSYYFNSEDGSVASTQITYWQFPSTSQATAFVATTTLVAGGCPVGSATFTYGDSVIINALKSSIVLLGSISNITNTIEYYVNSIETFEQTFLRPALTSISTSFITTYTDIDSSGTTGGSTYGDAYYSYEVQSFNTATAKAYSHVGDQFLYGLKLLEKVHGNGALAGAIYLHTSVSNKTDNTGYYVYSNNLSNDALPNILSYNATSILDNGQLSNYQENADNQYTYNAGFASINDDENHPPYIVTPISQSSYSWILYESSPPYIATTRITASFGGVSDSASYTTINGNGSTSSSSTGTISFNFAVPAGTRLSLDLVTDSFFPLFNNGAPIAVGGKRRLYTASNTILPQNFSTQFAYTLRNSVFTSSADHTYSQTDFSGFDTTSYFGTIPSNASVVTNLKYIRLNNDSWVVVDNDLTWGDNLGGALLETPTGVFSQQVYNAQSNRGIYASFETYYGSTYLN